MGSWNSDFEDENTSHEPFLCEKNAIVVLIMKRTLHMNVQYVISFCGQVDIYLD